MSDRTYGGVRTGAGRAAARGPGGGTAACGRDAGRGRGGAGRGARRRARSPGLGSHGGINTGCRPARTGGRRR